MKIVKDFKYYTEIARIDLNMEDPVTVNKEKIAAAIQPLFKTQPLIAVNYYIELAVKMDNFTADDFLGLVNLVNSVFFTSFTTGKGRNRERRLDIPESLSSAHVSAALLKRAINTTTHTDIFNVTIQCGSYLYYLVNGKGE